MTKEQEFRKQTEEAKFEAFSLMCKKVAELEEAKANLEYLLEGKDNEIDELKKENNVLAQNLEDTEILNNTYEKRFDNLKKENAELQQKWLNESYEKAKLVEKWKHNGENIIQECKDIEGAKTYYEHQLTKAKEIIKGLLELGSIGDGDYTYVAEAEQFLSEVEK